MGVPGGGSTVVVGGNRPHPRCRFVRSGVLGFRARFVDCNVRLVSLQPDRPCH